MNNQIIREGNNCGMTHGSTMIKQIAISGLTIVLFYVIILGYLIWNLVRVRKDTKSK